MPWLATINVVFRYESLFENAVNTPQTRLWSASMGNRDTSERFPSNSTEKGGRKEGGMEGRAGFVPVACGQCAEAQRRRDRASQFITQSRKHQSCEREHGRRVLRRPGEGRDRSVSVVTPRPTPAAPPSTPRCGSGTWSAACASTRSPSTRSPSTASPSAPTASPWPAAPSTSACISGTHR